MTRNKLKIAIVGGGAAGLMAAGCALENGCDVTIFEHMNKTGLKLGITGKGRCNVTNDCTNEEFLKNVPTNPKFLYSAISNFSTQDTKEFFEFLGVPLKTERGNRVFPVSDKALDIVYALRKYASRAKIIHEKVTGILSKDGIVYGIYTTTEYLFDRVIVCTGGASYPTTGSDGSSYKFLQKLGHTITPIRPSLVPLLSSDSICSDLQGLSLKNVGLKVFSCDKKVYEDFGEMLFTHFGLSGPMILSSSSHLGQISFDDLIYELDLKPALDDKQLNERLLRDFEANNNKDFINELSLLLPSKFHLPFANRCQVDPHKKVNEITKEERMRILQTLKHFRIKITGFQNIKDAIVTSGGVSVKEVSPKTMESKLHKGLYFAGEVLDVDAYTGGFNLQIAFCTARLAAMSACVMEE